MKIKKRLLLALGVAMGLLSPSHMKSSELKNRLTKIKDSASLVYNIIYHYSSSPEQRRLTYAQLKLEQGYPSALETYKKLNSNQENPFALSVGISLSQTADTANILHPEYLAELLQTECQKQPIDKRKKWLEGKWHYITRCLPSFTDKKGKAFYIGGRADSAKKKVIKDIAENTNSKKIALTRSPFTNDTNITNNYATAREMTSDNKKAMAQQLKDLGVLDQVSAKDLPTSRLSLELADTIDASARVDSAKLQKQASFVESLNNPMIFMHHYANPQAKPRLFESQDDIKWFADRCGQVAESMPGVKYICPISQPMGFGLQVARQGTLPPFSAQPKTDKKYGIADKLSKLDFTDAQTDQFLQNIIEAQVEASKAIKAKRPDVKILVSHQWKPMKRTYTADGLAKFCSTIAHNMYNKKFIQLLKGKEESFDGIALSVYPAMVFTGPQATGDNCSGKIDAQAALESIVEIAKAFPGKEIHIVETGCNHAAHNDNFKTKKQFVDMTLYVCSLARDMGINIKSCSFWGQDNDQYFEWNRQPGTVKFGPIDSNNKTEPINEYGLYLKEIVSQK